MQALTQGLLKVDPGLLIWTLITFSILVLILWKAAWKPIIAALDARADRVRSEIENAEKSRQEAEKVLVQYKEMMSNAKEEASKIISLSKNEAEKVKNEIIEKATLESKAIVDRAKNEINLAKENALADIKSEVVFLSTDIATKILKKNINADDQKAIVKETLDKMRTVQ
jgi:F-type H+-transporting ATPase subunit b